MVGWTVHLSITKWVYQKYYYGISFLNRKRSKFWSSLELLRLCTNTSHYRMASCDIMDLGSHANSISFISLGFSVSVKFYFDVLMKIASLSWMLSISILLLFLKVIFKKSDFLSFFFPYYNICFFRSDKDYIHLVLSNNNLICIDRL